ncbi:MAG: methylenetetrahydrofolate--tRNA-(uracil(54)-C(5))-methyltransferase (FADH(2)-oxidizing) TrmFO, partial [Firmicutes bacterium]|nr:methylenetetrahydrofolate--tRNA-(uracil(54)-C(5))-methyltransferase (FADH(2)-oxidizing) TrmFO [Bacillota bacterium]
CSNSLRSASLHNAVGVLKEEMRRLHSVIMQAADATRVPAGGALAVDRERFAETVTELVSNHPLVRVTRDVVKRIPEAGVVVVATGPLTESELAADVQAFTGERGFYFYDAAAPVVERASIDDAVVFTASRYDKGEAAYLNCPMTEAEFDAFYDALVTAQVVLAHEFEREIFFEGCMPIEAMAQRGRKTVLFGPMKPVGLRDPRTGRRPFAVVQLRQDNAAASLYNLVGFQTRLRFGEQERVFRMIPGLEGARFVRYGVMHRNAYINSPAVLSPTYQAKKRPTLLFAGQMTGVEGYVESAASGLCAGVNAARLACGKEPVIWPPTTAMGSLAHYITHADARYFQPMNATFGLLAPLSPPIADRSARNRELAERALQETDAVARLLRG